MRLVLVLACLIGAGLPRVSAQSDLDALMARVLARRDDNWKKLQQYVLDERETLDVTGTDGRPLYGYVREYLWFPRPSTTPGADDAVFIRSPLTADGVRVGEPERRRAEASWMARRKPGETTMEPGFVSAAYFLTFAFEPGQYALVGRERHEGRDVLQIEYYPTRMFREGRTRPNRRLRGRDDQIEARMNKVSLVTVWVDAAQHQIVKYEVRNIDFDFLPVPWFTRLEQVTAAMDMTQPFPDVWLPRRITLGFEMSLATGRYQGSYRSEFRDYRLATVDTRVR